MTIDRGDVEHVARLARLALEDDEIELYGGQLSKILEHAGRVTALDTGDVPPTSHAISASNVTRADKVAPGLSQEQALANAPAAQDGYFRVPRIQEEEQL